MRFKVIVTLGLTAVALSACKNDNGITDAKPIPPAALIRFVNAAVDTGTVDFRFIDKVENLPTLLGVKFRGASGGYQRVTPGTRPVRVFTNSTVDSLTSKRLVDTTITLNADTRYTLVYYGQARGNNDRLLVLQDPATMPTPPAGKIMVRVLNVDPSLPSADVYIARSDTTNPMAKPAATITRVAVQTYSAFATLDTAGSTFSYKFAVAPAGSATASFTSTPSLVGAAAATSTAGPQPGVRIPGSVLTALITGVPTVGSRADSSAYRADANRVVLLVDKVLNP